VSPPSGDVVRILVVEDAFDQALLVKSFLQSAGEFDIVHSQDGDQAARLLEEQEWDLLITDLNLPGIDGFDLTRRARAKDPPLPVLAMTGYTGSHYAESVFRAGANDLVTKPLDKDEFLLKVRELLGGHRSTSVLAIGGLAGDVEMGCGATLAKAAQAGEDVLVIPLCADDMDATGAGLIAAREAAELLGVRILVDETAMDDTTRRVELVETVVRDLKPQTMFIPAMDDAHPARREAFRIGKLAASSVSMVLGYQTATTGLDFKPQRYEEIADQMMQKMEALTIYQTLGAGRVDLAPRLAQAYARYWGRFMRFTDVEAFEVIQGEE
jgi:DNA-binding response OmpR family regulator